MEVVSAFCELKFVEMRSRSETYNGALFMELSKAFDCLPHGLVLRMDATGRLPQWAQTAG